MTVEEIKCRYCNGNELDVEFDPLTKEIPNMRWAKCPSCGFTSHFPYITDTEQASLYVGEWVIGENPEDAKWADYGYLRKSCEHNAKLVDQFRKKFPERRYLEVAASQGFLMHNMKDKGWNVWGQEIRSKDVRLAAERGLTIEQCSIFDYKPPTRFDVISCREFIEHVWDFRRLLQLCHSWLEKGGHLWIQTQVTDGARDFTNRYVYQAGHVSLFTEKLLLEALTAAGFTPFVTDRNNGCRVVRAEKITCPS